MVLIETWQHTIDLASDIALECYRTGAKPMITLMTDRLWWNALEQLPDQYIRKPPRHILNAADSITVWILLGGPQDPTKFREIPATRLESYFEGEKPVLDKTFEKKVRTAEVLLGQITPERARTYDLDYVRWLKMTEDAIKTDYSKMAELGRKIANRLERGSRIHLTSRTGTDLKFDITKRPVHVQDGIVDQEDIGRGLVSTRLPSGKVEVAPLEDSAQGTIVFEATKGDKANIGQFVVGLNPRVELIGYTTDELALGTASVGVGENRGIGGKNDSSFAFSGTIERPTIAINGSTVMENGRISL